MRVKSFVCKGRGGICIIKLHLYISCISILITSILYVPRKIKRSNSCAAFINTLTLRTTSSPCRMTLFRRTLALSSATFEFIHFYIYIYILYSIFPRFSVGIQSMLCLSQYLAGLNDRKWRPQNSFTLLHILYSVASRLIAENKRGRGKRTDARSYIFEIYC